jgi:hypothetical protein
VWQTNTPTNGLKLNMAIFYGSVPLPMLNLQPTR